MILKFFGFFVGPIQFVMEVRRSSGRLCPGTAALKRNIFPTCRLDNSC